MRIAVTQRVEYLTKRDEYRDALDHRVVQLIVKLGCLPILIPNSLEPMKIEELLKDTKLQGIILTGEHNCKQSQIFHKSKQLNAEPKGKQKQTGKQS